MPSRQSSYREYHLVEETTEITSLFTAYLDWSSNWTNKFLGYFCTAPAGLALASKALRHHWFQPSWHRNVSFLANLGLLRRGSFALLCVGPAWALPGFASPSLASALPPLCVSLPLCWVFLAPEKILQPKLSLPLTAWSIQIVVLPLALAIRFHWSMLCAFSKWPSSLLK